MTNFEQKTSGAVKAIDRRKVKRFVDPRDGKVYVDITDFWNKTYYEDFITDGELDAAISLMHNSK